MKCLILAAGYATRLYPLTENFPKPLLPIGGRPILDWLIDDIDTTGVVDEYVLISNHKYAHCFNDWVKSKPQKITVIDDGSVSNETRLGAVKDIQFAIEQRGIDDDMLVIAGDNVLDFSMTCFLAYVRKKQASCIMRYFEPDEKKLLKCGVVTIDVDDKVLAMTEKSPAPATNWCCPPFYYFTKADAKMVQRGISSGCGTDAPGSYIAWLCAQTTVYAMEMPGNRYDIGDLIGYEKIKAEYRGIRI